MKTINYGLPYDKTFRLRLTQNQVEWLNYTSDNLNITPSQLLRMILNNAMTTSYLGEEYANK